MGHKTRKLYYQDYEYRGHRIVRSSNPQALPCKRWGIWDGPLAGQSAFSLAGAKRLIDSSAEARS